MSPGGKRWGSTPGSIERRRRTDVLLFGGEGVCLGAHLSAQLCFLAENCM